MKEDKTYMEKEYPLECGSPYEVRVKKGYELQDENGKTINGTKFIIVKKPSKYPKTYEECCAFLGYKIFQYDAPHFDNSNAPYYWSLVSLQKLLICRDTYWVIAGDEAGLGMPWRPDWKHGMEHWIIGTYMGDFFDTSTESYRNTILAFPSEDMRDAFYNNFEELIIKCKELL